MGPPKFEAPGNCPICPPLKPALPLLEGILEIKQRYMYYAL